ncbi:MAG: response regulator [Anaerolineae bacterium]|nr:response regulator [Anaerolineae bacterium]
MTQKLGEGAHILVVDDEMGMREGCRRALAPAGYRVDLAPDLARARDLIAGSDYDLYLLDVMLPDGSGLSLLDSILNQNPDAICIIITGFGNVEMAVDAVRRGAYNFLSKPFTSDELLVAVEQGLERHRLKAVERQAEELYRAKEELEHLDEMKSHLMLKVAHELRAPAAAAQSYVNLIVAGYVPPSEVTPTLSRVQARLQEMLNLTSDLLELARLKEARGLPAQAGEQDVASILKEVYEMLSDQARNKSQSFQIEILNHPIMVANREHIRQIWTNLISNAIKYTPDKGRIAVRLQVDQDVLIGVVEDSGIGMSEQEMEHLFQEFFRTDAAKATGEIGTGLGLSIVKQIVDSYGGEIKATSKVGQGTRFRFILPLQPKLERPEPRAGARPQHAPIPGAPHVYRGTHTANLVRGGDAVPEARP